MKKISLFLLCAILFVSLFACAPKEKTGVSVMTLKGPTGMGMAKLMEDSANEKTDNQYTFKLASAPEEISAAVLQGSTDIAAVPVNLAAVLYKKTNGEYVTAAINTLGVLYLLESGDSIQSIGDLRGKTVYATGQGATPEYILRYLLSKNGIDPDKDITIEYKTEHAELAALMAAGEVVLGMLPEPNVTSVLTQNKEMRIALNLTEEWNKTAENNGTLLQGCVIVKKSFLNENKEAVDAFLQEYKSSIEFVSTNLDDAAALMEKYEIIPKAAVAKAAAPRCNIVYIDGTEMKNKMKAFLEILYEANPASIGGVIPDDNFYYTK